MSTPAPVYIQHPAKVYGQHSHPDLAVCPLPWNIMLGMAYRCDMRVPSHYSTVQYSSCGRGSQTSALASEPRAHEGARRPVTYVYLSLSGQVWGPSNHTHWYVGAIKLHTLVCLTHPSTAPSATKYWPHGSPTCVKAVAKDALGFSSLYGTIITRHRDMRVSAGSSSSSNINTNSTSAHVLRLP